MYEPREELRIVLRTVIGEEVTDLKQQAEVMGDMEHGALWHSSIDPEKDQLEKKAKAFMADDEWDHDYVLSVERVKPLWVMGVPFGLMTDGEWYGYSGAEYGDLFFSAPEDENGVQRDYFYSKHDGRVSIVVYMYFEQETESGKEHVQTYETWELKDSGDM